MSFKVKAISGLFWTFVDTFFLKGILFLFTIYVARVIGPQAFGLFGILMIFISFGTVLIESGIPLSLVRTKYLKQKDFSTVFFTNFFISILIYFIFYFTAPFIAVFFNQSALVLLIRVYCLSFVLSSFTSIQTSMLMRELKFKQITKLNFPGILIGLIISVYLVENGQGIWSLVLMYLTSQLINVILLWMYSNWRPKFEFSKVKFKLHFYYGYKLMLAAMLEIVFKNLYNILIGKFFNIKVLAFYERAQTLNEYPITVVTGIINKVSYPLLSNIKSQKEFVSNAYKKLIKTTFFVTTPIIISVIVISRPLFLIILGKEWESAYPFFQILCLASIFYPIHALNIVVLKVFGRTDLYLKIEIYKKIIITLSILLFFKFGIYGLLWSNVANSLISLIINTYYSGKFIDYNLKKQILDMLPVILVSAFMGLIIYFILQSVLNYNLFLQVLIPLFSGYIFYFIWNFLFKNETFFYISRTIKNLKNDFSN